MPQIVEPKLEFRKLSEEAVTAALGDSDPDNPIATEVARLLNGYAANFHAHVERLGHMPEHILRHKPRWPIEAVAMRLMAETIRRSLAEHAE